MINLHRKQDTRNKIMMGGLVIKAGLEEIYQKDKAIILGILIDAKDKLSNKEYLDYITKLGNTEFGKRINTNFLITK